MDEDWAASLALETNLLDNVSGDMASNLQFVTRIRSTNIVRRAECVSGDRGTRPHPVHLCVCRC